VRGGRSKILPDHAHGLLGKKPFKALGLARPAAGRHQRIQHASPDGFPREMRTYGYDLQAAFYLRTLREAGFDAKKFIFVAVEKEPPYAVGLHVMTDRYLEHANVRVTRTLEKINAAIAADDYTTGWPMINDIDLPRWQLDPEADVFDETVDF